MADQTEAATVVAPVAAPEAAAPGAAEEKKDEEEGSPITSAIDSMSSAMGTIAPGLRVLTSVVGAVSSAMKPAKQVPEPDIKELKEGISNEVLEEYILKKQFELDLYQEYEELEMKNKTGNDTDDPEINLENFKCKQSGGAGPEKYINTNLKEIINEKIICKYVKELIVKIFEEFMDKKVMHPHFHSRDAKTNNIDTLSIFYRHGLSKIISQMMNDIKNEEGMLDFFLNEIVKIVMEMEDKKMIEFLESIDRNFLFEVMNSEKVIDSNKYNKSHETKMKKLLLKLYPESEFNDLMIEMEKESKGKNKLMSISEIKKWKEIYNNTLNQENQIENEKRADEKRLLEKIGLDKVLKLFHINKTAKKIANIPSFFINKKTNLEDIDVNNNRKGGRITKKKRPNAKNVI